MSLNQFKTTADFISADERGLTVLKIVMNSTLPPSDLVRDAWRQAYWHGYKWHVRRTKTKSSIKLQTLAKRLGHFSEISEK